MPSEKERLRESRRIIDEVVRELRDGRKELARRLSRPLRRYVLVEDSGIINGRPDEAYLAVVTSDPGGGRPLFVHTPGHRWRFEQFRRPLRLRHASRRNPGAGLWAREIRRGEIVLTVDADGRPRLRFRDRTYPGDPAGWHQLLDDLFTDWNAPD